MIAEPCYSARESENYENVGICACLQSDQQCNQVRRLQRSNDELQQQVDSLSIQVQHLQTRRVDLSDYIMSNYLLLE